MEGVWPYYRGTSGRNEMGTARQDMRAGPGRGGPASPHVKTRGGGGGRRHAAISPRLILLTQALCAFRNHSAPLLSSAASPPRRFGSSERASALQWQQPDRRAGQAAAGDGENFLEANIRVGIMTSRSQ